MKREYWIDELKGIAILFVVFEHTIARTVAGLHLNSAPLNNVDFFIKTFHMPLFFLASGYIYAMHERNKLKESSYTSFVKKKFFDLFVPYLIFAVPIWLGKFIFSKWVTRPVGVKDLFMMFLNPIAFLWFIYILFFIEILVAGLDKVTNYKTEIIFAAALIMALSRCFITTNIKLVDRVLYYPICYTSGLMFYKYRDVLKKNISVFISVILSLACWWLVFNYRDNRIAVILINISSIIMITSVIYKIRCNSSEKNFISFLGQISIYIYILHPIILNVIRVCLLKLHISIIPVWFVVLFFGGVIGTLVYYWLTTKIWLFDLPFKPRRVYISKIKKEKSSN